MGKCSWKALRGQIFLEASEIFLRLLKGEIISSDQIRKTVLTRSNFRSDEDWSAVQEAYSKDNEVKDVESIIIPNRYN